MTRVGRFTVSTALIAGAIAFAPGLADASPREQPLPPLPTFKQAQPAPPKAAPDDALQDGGFYIESDQLIDDEPHHMVSARGGVEARYGGRVLRADSIDYDSTTGVVTAKGHITIINPDNSAEYAETAVLDKQMSEGVATAFSTRLKETARQNGLSGGAVDVSIVASSAVKPSPTITELNNAVFTACPVCAQKPNPTWSIEARQVIEDKQRQLIIFKGAVIKVHGLPIFYTPAIWEADPAVKRKSGLLIPEINISSLRGLSYEQPYLQVLSPSADLVVSPQINTKVNPFLNVDYRQRFYSGAIDVRTGYTYEQDFNSEGEKLGNPTSRSYVLAKGLFAINDNWDWGFTAERASDPLIFDRYGVAEPFLDRGLYSADDRRLISQLFTTYQDPSSYVSVSTIDVQGLRSNDINSTFPAVAPLIEAHWAPNFAILGGRLQIDGGGVALFRDAAPADPSMPGINSQRGSFEANWQSTYIFGPGIRVDPFLDVRSDVYALQKLPTPFSPSATVARTLPTAGVTVSWPFYRHDDGLTYIIEPIAQVALAPFLRQDPRIPNEDSVDFAFDETNLFQINKSPGFDLLDSGQRLNVGGRFTVENDAGMSASALIGRSFRAQPDPYLPARSGLSATSSDWILAASASPWTGVNFFTRWRLDSADFNIAQMETGVDVTTGRFDGQIRYLQEAQNAAGLPVRDLDFHGEAFITKHWGISAYGAFESGVWRQNDFGIVYRDECVRVEVLYRRNNTNNGVLGPSQGIGIRLSLATFGNSVYSTPQNTGPTR